MTRNRVLLAALAVAVVVAVVLAWRTTRDEDPYDAYCAEVRKHQESLGEELVAGGASTGLINALPAFTLLQEQAPDDIADDWTVVVSRIRDLVAAIEEAGADPASYDREALPAGVSRAERQRIEDAAAALDLPATTAAFAGVSQHSRDVCHTPLYHAQRPGDLIPRPALPGGLATG